MDPGSGAGMTALESWMQWGEVMPWGEAMPWGEVMPWG